jgi:hypothetical protein
MQSVDLHLRTKAYLYSNSFMQCSFVKIQDLIGYVSEYMLMRPKTTYKATYVCILFVMIWMKIKLLLACLCKFHSRADIIGAYAESEYI